MSITQQDDFSTLAAIAAVLEPRRQRERIINILSVVVAASAALEEVESPGLQEAAQHLDVAAGLIANEL